MLYKCCWTVSEMYIHYKPISLLRCLSMIMDNWPVSVYYNKKQYTRIAVIIWYLLYYTGWYILQTNYVQRTKRIQTIKTVYKQVVKNRNKLNTWWPELAFRLDGQVVEAAVAPFHVQIKNAFVIEILPAGAHQRWQMKMTWQGVEDEPCHRREILVTDLTLLYKIDGLHRLVSDFLTSVCVLEAVWPDLATVQANEIQSLSGVHVLFNFGQVTPHPRRNQNMKPKLANLKPTVKVI